MKHVYSGTENMTANERHEYSNNLIRQSVKTMDTDGQLSNVRIKKLIPGGDEQNQVNIVQLKDNMRKIRQRQAQSVMKKPYSISLQVGARDEAAKTSWKKKRGNITIVDQTRFGSTTITGDGI